MLPFTYETSLEPGQNLFVILARDQDGLQSIRSVVIWYDETGAAPLTSANLPIEGGQR